MNRFVWHLLLFRIFFVMSLVTQFQSYTTLIPTWENAVQCFNIFVEFIPYGYVFFQKGLLLSFLGPSSEICTIVFHLIQFLCCACPGAPGWIRDMQSPMVLAGLNGSISCIQVLLKRGVRVTHESLMLLATGGCGTGSAWGGWKHRGAFSAHEESLEGGRCCSFIKTNP